MTVVIQALLSIPVHGSILLFLTGVAIYLFFATAIGIFLGTVARSMPQFGLLYMLGLENSPNKPVTPPPVTVVSHTPQPSPTVRHTATPSGLFAVRVVADGGS